jgi:deoxyribodipyrimidine photo-lyase
MHDLSELTGDPRVTIRRGGPVDPDGRAVVYWMQRAQRGRDNPALDTAIAAGNRLGKPVVVFVGITPRYPNANLRHYRFFAEGLIDVERDLKRRRVGLVIRPHPEDDLLRFTAEARPCLVVGDENPMREPEQWRRDAAARLPVPFWTVDADLVVPCSVIPREPYAARTLRPRLRAEVPRFLAPQREESARVAWRKPAGLLSSRPTRSVLDGLPIDGRVGPVREFRGGTRAGERALKQFLRERLNGYASARNHPESTGTSRLSPYLHFGHLGPRSIALAVHDPEVPREHRDAFLEQLIVRRELAIRFVRFNSHYDQLAGCEPWAIKTLARHERDHRPVVYSERQLEQAETHDPLWNACQRQMVTTGWMHGYVRMYWAKKILEWTRRAEDAFEIAIALNDRYELDGRDPNGYAGIAWAIGGKHDRAWGPERPIFGTVRYMSFASTSRKFDSRQYIEQVQAAMVNSESGTGITDAMSAHATRQVGNLEEEPG